MIVASRILGRTLLLALCLTALRPAAAHDLGLGTLEIQAGAGEHTTLLVLHLHDRAAADQAQFLIPEGSACTVLTGGPPSQKADGSTVLRATIRCPARTGVQWVDIRSTGNGLFVRHGEHARLVHARKGSVRVQLGTDPSGALPVAAAYVRLGIEHILTGPDHLLFVLGIVLLVARTRQLLVALTAFTLAHSITLTSASLGLLHLRGPPVEAAIAWSVALIGREVVRRPGAGHDAGDISPRFPTWGMAFLFGLIHGFGFAGALSELGFPQGQLTAALLAFNIGVECGQILFVLTIGLLAGCMDRAGWAIAVARRGAGLVIGSVATSWFIARTVSIVAP